MPYVAITCLAAFIGFIVFQTVRGRLDVLSMPFIVACMFAYLYVISPLKLMADGDVFRYVTEAQIAKGVWVPLAVLAAFWVGWTIGSQSRRSRGIPGDGPAIDPVRVYRAGVALSLFGLALWISFVMFSGGVVRFYSAVHGGAGRWGETTAYQYSGLAWVYAGLAMMVAGTLRQPRARRAFWLAIACLSSLLLAHSILMGGRGPLFCLVGALTSSYYLASRRRPPAVAVVVAGCVFGLLLLALVSYRSYTPIGKWNQAAHLTIAEAAEPALRAGPGNEFILHAGVIATVDRTRKVGFGERYLWYHLVHPIPRVLWPEKPYGSPSGSITHADMLSVVGWVPGVGSAAGNVAEWYREWWLFSIVVWGAMGCGFGLAYAAAVRPLADPWWVVLYALIVSGSLHLIAQGFLAFWESFLLQVILSYVLWRVYVQARRLPFARRGGRTPLCPTA